MDGTPKKGGATLKVNAIPRVGRLTSLPRRKILVGGVASLFSLPLASMARALGVRGEVKRRHEAYAHSGLPGGRRSSGADRSCASRPLQVARFGGHPDVFRHDFKGGSVVSFGDARSVVLLGEAALAWRPTLEALLERYEISRQPVYASTRRTSSTLGRALAFVSPHRDPGGSPVSDGSSDIVIVVTDLDDERDVAELIRAIERSRRKDEEMSAVVVVGGIAEALREGEAIGELLSCADGVVGLSASIAAAGPSGGDEIVGALETILDGIFFHGFIGYDFNDLRSTLHAGRIFTLGMGSCDIASLDELASGAKDPAAIALDDLVAQGVDLDAIGAVLLRVHGRSDLSLIDIDRLTTEVMERVPDEDALIVFYSVSDDDAALEISILAASRP